MNYTPEYGIRKFACAADAAGLALWSWNVDTDEIALDERAHGLWGVPQNSPVTFEDLSARIHPADLDRVRAAFTGTRATWGPSRNRLPVTGASAFRLPTILE